MNGAQFRGVMLKNAGITTDDTEGTTLATLSAIGHKIEFVKAAADGAAATATAETAIGQIPAVAGRGASFVYVPSAALTGDPTNNATVTIRRRPSGGGAAVTIATLTTTASWTAFVPVTITNSNVTLVTGDVITFEITKGGTGVVVPSGTLQCNLLLSADVTSLTAA